MKNYKMFLVAIIALFLSACGGNVKLEGDAKEIASKNYKFSEVEIQLSEHAKSQIAKSNAFDKDKMHTSVMTLFKKHGLYSKSSPTKAVFKLTDIRVRHALGAMVFGFLVGDDHIHGTVTVIDNGQTKESFNVKASYALGGVAGAVTSIRMAWLYRKFTELSIQTFTGKSVYPDEE